jgi:hypothetical protein
MSEKYFIWKIDSQLDGRLRAGERHLAGDFDPAILAEWIRTGAAEWAPAEKTTKASKEV